MNDSPPATPATIGNLFFEQIAPTPGDRERWMQYACAAISGRLAKGEHYSLVSEQAARIATEMLRLEKQHFEKK